MKGEHFSEAGIASGLNRLLETKIKEAVQKAADDAAEQARQMVLSQMASIAARVDHQLNVEQRGHDIVITLKMQVKES